MLYCIARRAAEGPRSGAGGERSGNPSGGGALVFRDAPAHSRVGSDDDHHDDRLMSTCLISYTYNIITYKSVQFHYLSTSTRHAKVSKNATHDEPLLLESDAARPGREVSGHRIILCYVILFYIIDTAAAAAAATAAATAATDDHDHDHDDAKEPTRGTRAQVSPLERFNLKEKSSRGNSDLECRRPTNNNNYYE